METLITFTGHMTHYKVSRDMLQYMVGEGDRYYKSIMRDLKKTVTLDSKQQRHAAVYQDLQTEKSERGFKKLWKIFRFK